MYLALYRKWRPKTFDDVIGQNHITLTLKNQIETKKTSHAYLFTGPRGTGKTTCSKAFAMAINCLNPSNGNPCCECEICAMISQGSTLDVVEIDAASNNGVDNIRQLREEAYYTPVNCQYRVYIIDETHMLSIGAFNALLKIMEEPPKHVVFILATTELQKVPPTILSRCQRYDFRRIKSEDIAGRLEHIADNEDFTLTLDGAELIARLADGGMRDALSILDQATAYSKDVTKQTIEEVVGLVDNEYLDEFAKAFENNDSESVIMLVDKLYTNSKDLSTLCDELCVYFRDMLLNKASMGKIKTTVEYQSNLTVDRLIDILTQLQQANDTMSKSLDKRLSLEMVLIKLTTQNQLQTTQPTAPVIDPNIMMRIEQLETKITTATVQAKTSNISQQSKVPPTELKVTVSDDAKLLDCWDNIMEELKTSEPSLYGILKGSRAFDIDGNRLIIESPYEMLGGMIRKEGNAIKLISIAYKYTNIKYKLGVRANTNLSVTTTTVDNSGVLDILQNNADKFNLTNNNMEE